MGINVAEHSKFWILVFSALTILFFAIGGYLFFSSSPVTKAMGFASFASGMLSLVATLYVGSVRFTQKYLFPFLKEIIRRPITISIMATVGADNIGEFKENLKKIKEEMERDEKFKEEYL